MKEQIRHFVRTFRHWINRGRNEAPLNPAAFDKVLFVAHPDDELLFFFRPLLENPGWLVVCLTNGGSAVRCREFLSLMAELGHQRQIWNLKDCMAACWNETKTISKVARILSLKTDWKMVATHNAGGEYGHPQHRQLHRIVREAAGGQLLHVPTDFADLCSPANELPSEIRAKKRDLLELCYPSQKQLIEANHENWMIYERLVTAASASARKTE